MAQTTVLASGTGAANSSDIVLTTPATFAINAGGAAIPRNISLAIMLVSGSNEEPLASLNWLTVSASVAAPATVRIKRPDISAYGQAIAVTMDQ